MTIKQNTNGNLPDNWTFDILERQLSLPAVPYNPASISIPMPDQDAYSRQLQCVTQGMDKLIRQGSYEFAVLSPERVFDDDYKRGAGDDYVLEASTFAKNTGNWAVMMFPDESAFRMPRYTALLGWEYALRAAEMLSVAKYIPDNIAHILCLGESLAEYLPKLEAAGVPILYRYSTQEPKMAHGNPTAPDDQLLPLDAFTVVADESKPVDRFSFADVPTHPADKYIAEACGLRLNLVSEELAPGSSMDAMYTEHVWWLFSRFSETRLKDLFVDLSDSSHTLTDKLSPLSINKVYAALTADAAPDSPAARFVGHGRLWPVANPAKWFSEGQVRHSYYNDTSREELVEHLADNSDDVVVDNALNENRRRGAAYPGEFVMSKTGLGELTEELVRACREMDDVISIWKFYEESFGIRLTYSSGKSDDGAYERISRAAAATGAAAAVRAYFEGVPVDDIMAGVRK